MTYTDLFWLPKVGDLVEFKPGTLRHQDAMKCELSHPLRVTKACECDGRAMVWYEPTGPQRKKVLPNGKVRIEAPTYQAPALVECLMPYTNEEINERKCRSKSEREIPGTHAGHSHRSERRKAICMDSD